MAFITNCDPWANATTGAGKLSFLKTSDMYSPETPPNHSAPCPPLYVLCCASLNVSAPPFQVPSRPYPSPLPGMDVHEAGGLAQRDPLAHPPANLAPPYADMGPYPLSSGPLQVHYPQQDGSQLSVASMADLLPTAPDLAGARSGSP
eukprot:gene6466-6232_t